MNVFEMIIDPDLEYPLICIGVKHDHDPQRLKLDLLNLNSNSNWYNDDDYCYGDGADTVVNRYEQMRLICVKQVDHATLLICYDSE